MFTRYSIYVTQKQELLIVNQTQYISEKSALQQRKRILWSSIIQLQIHSCSLTFWYNNHATSLSWWKCFQRLVQIDRLRWIGIIWSVLVYDILLTKNHSLLFSWNIWTIFVMQNHLNTKNVFQHKLHFLHVCLSFHQYGWLCTNLFACLSFSLPAALFNFSLISFVCHFPLSYLSLALYFLIWFSIPFSFSQFLYLSLPLSLSSMTLMLSLSL